MGASGRGVMGCGGVGVVGTIGKAFGKAVAATGMEGDEGCAPLPLDSLGADRTLRLTQGTWGPWPPPPLDIVA